MHLSFRFIGCEMNPLNPLVILEGSSAQERGAELPEAARTGAKKEERPIKIAPVSLNTYSLYPVQLDFGGRAMLPDFLDQDEPAVASLGRYRRRARPGEGVKDEIPRFRIRFNERRKCEKRLLIGMELV